ncbi:putative membrane protein [Leucobacter luti]|uniref:DUF1304 domain-containing protein n=1 Tax=Leucobacter luti TaxID=340320 RepID=UPI0010470EAA|nr:DUF1304 domain-containing protein [Leucobacter luti]MCW2288373.1 putative membrane protein [Leucobacter luti]TCK45470.1 putative membrane protein [Leucobacter luti]
MLIVGLVLTGLAAALHVFIFYLESIAWTSSRARATFGTTLEEAEATKQLAFNQGFYNLFLAIAGVLGIVLFAAGNSAVGATLIILGAGSMLAASLVLLLSSRAQAAAAVKQGTLPLLGLVFFVIGLLA